LQAIKEYRGGRVARRSKPN